jgi:Uma2 family endonuclease
MQFGVPEYWIVKPKSKVVEVYVLEDGIYTEPTVYFKDIVSSSIFKDLSFEINSVFE